ncbi:MAG: four helix bundle protein [Bacteroidota bacterium]
MIKRFEELECWQAARQLVNTVFEICDEGRLARDYDLRSQLRRAALSTMNNIAEGFGRRKSQRDLIRFLDYTDGSCCEVQSITYVLEDRKYVDLEKIHIIREQSEKVKAKTLAFIAAVRRNL